MDIRDIRRNNLRTLMDREYGVGARGAQSRLADKLGKPQNFVSRCLADPTRSGAKTIGEDFARDIESAFGLPRYSLDQRLTNEFLDRRERRTDEAGFMGREDFPLAQDRREPGTFVAEQPRVYDTGMNNVAPALQPHRAPKRYPLISWVAAGERAESPDNFSPGDGEELIESTENAGPGGYWLDVRGNSMQGDSLPSFPAGMKILVRPEGFELVSGKFYVAKHVDGETTFKQYVRDAGTSYLVPLNPSYKTVEMDDEWRIIGRVVDAKVTGL